MFSAGLDLPLSKGTQIIADPIYLALKQLGYNVFGFVISYGIIAPVFDGETMAPARLSDVQMSCRKYTCFNKRETIMVREY